MLSHTVQYIYEKANPRISLIKKKTKFSLIYKEIKMGSGAKSYMRKSFLKYEETRKYLNLTRNFPNLPFF